MSGNSFERRKKVVKEIILDLHRGLTLEEARDRFQREVGEISSNEIADIEQSLIDEGMSPKEIKEFCNVHALLFKSALEKNIAQEESPAHPVYLFRLENREIEKITQALKEAMARVDGDEEDPMELKEKIEKLLNKLRDIELHYTRKEQLLFPYLEKYGFMGPSKVMWGKDNEIRDLYKQALSEIAEVRDREVLRALIEKNLNLLVEEVEGMIFKEENILFPTSLEKLKLDDWVDILKESDQVGYAFIQEPPETSHLVESLKKALVEESLRKDNAIAFHSGTLTLKISQDHLFSGRLCQQTL